MNRATWQIILGVMLLASATAIYSCGGGGDNNGTPGGGNDAGGGAADTGGGSTAPTAQELQDAMTVEGATAKTGELPAGSSDPTKPQITDVVIPSEVGPGKIFQVTIKFHTGSAALQKMLVKLDGASGYFEMAMQSVPNTDGMVSFPMSFDLPTKSGALMNSKHALTASTAKALDSTKVTLVVQLVDETGGSGEAAKQDLTVSGQSGTCTGDGCEVPIDHPDAGFDAGQVDDTGVDAGVDAATDDAGVVDAGQDTGPVDAGCDAEDDYTFCTRLGKECGGPISDNDNCGDPRTVPDCGSCNYPAECGTGADANKCVYLKAVKLLAGHSYSCLVTDKGGMKCWGAGSLGNLGDGSNSDKLVPVDVQGLTSGVKDIALSNDPTGYDHTCAVTDQGAAKCWGDNTYSQLGDGTNDPANTPKDVQGLATGASTIFSGRMHTCAMVGTAYKCWGYGYSYELGTGTSEASNVPLDATALGTNTTALSLGDGYLCGIVGSAAKCLGANLSGQLGNGSAGSSEAALVQVLGLSSNVKSIASGTNTTCAITNLGAVKCWGAGAGGQLGDGNSADSAMPVQVKNLPSGVSQVVSNQTTVCALMSAGGIKCWGNPGVSFGDSSPASPWAEPVDITGFGTGIKSIALGAFHLCALYNSGSVKCTGSNGSSGRLGNNSTTDATTPVTVLGFDPNP